MIRELQMFDQLTRRQKKGSVKLCSAIPDSFCAGTTTITDRVSVRHTDFYCRESHIG